MICNEQNYLTLLQFNGSYNASTWQLWDQRIILGCKEIQRDYTKGYYKIDHYQLSQILEQNFQRLYHLETSQRLNTVLLVDTIPPTENFWPDC